MQVARANINLSASVVDAPTRKTTSYAPLYLTTTLGQTSFDIEYLEAIALDRLKILKASERARAAALHTPSNNNNSNINNNNNNNGITPTGAGGKVASIRTAIRDAEKQHGMNVPTGTGSNTAAEERAEQIMKDEASHFLVRLALCRTHEQRQWLLSAECDLFGTRLEFTGVDFALRALSKVSGAPSVTPATTAEVERFKLDLDAVARGPCRAKKTGDKGARYYKVNFEQVASLVKSRRVLLHNGIAFVPERYVADIVSQQFRARLSAGLATAAKAGAVADADPRLRLVLESIRQHFTAEAEKKAFDANAKRNAVDKISLRELDEALQCMPLCMRHMMHKLRENHHLRHAARMQLGVFLKGCGLTMDESLRFWKMEFGKGDISGDKFEKNYAYNIRHHYGKEGKRKNLQPFNCMKVINERPGPNEHHGCPYREMQHLKLAHTLRASGVDPNNVQHIVQTAAASNFQLACGLCFTATQPGHHDVSDAGIPEYIPNHPNEYFIEARRRRLGPPPEENEDGDEEEQGNGATNEGSAVLDDDIDEDEMISAVLAAEKKTNCSQQEKDNASTVNGESNKEKEENRIKSEDTDVTMKKNAMETEEKEGCTKPEDKDRDKDKEDVDDRQQSEETETGGAETNGDVEMTDGSSARAEEAEAESKNDRNAKDDDERPAKIPKVIAVEQS